MKITWIHNYNYPNYIGGAELSDFKWMQKGKQLGYKIREVTQASENLPNADLYIIGNYSKINKKILEKATSKPYINIIHAKALEEPFDQFYQKSKCLVFLSPEHKKRHKKIISANKYYITPPFVNPSVFYDRKQPREPRSYLYAGAIRSFKGIMRVLEYVKKHPGNYYFCGPTKPREAFLVDKINKTDNCKYLGTATYDQIPMLMNKYETFIWLPPENHFESFGRTVVEAILCGMRTIVNKKSIGAFSWKWNFKEQNTIAKHMIYYYESFWPNILRFL